MTNSTLTTAIFALLAGCISAAPSAVSQTADIWLAREDGSLVEETSGVVCPSIVDEYQRTEAASFDAGGFCAYESETGQAFTVQFYERTSADVETELVRTLSHFEDRGAVASAATSLGCEANLASVAAGGSTIADLAASFNDYIVSDDLRCLVLEDADHAAWVISLQDAGDYFISTISSSPNGRDAEIAGMVTASSHFHALQFIGPSV